MPRKITYVECEKVEKAVQLWIACPKLTAVQAMKATDFSKNDAECPTLQQQICRRRAAIQEEISIHSSDRIIEAPVAIAVKRPQEDVSQLTSQTTVTVPSV